MRIYTWVMYILKYLFWYCHYDLHFVQAQANRARIAFNSDLFPFVRIYSSSSYIFMIKKRFNYTHLMLDTDILSIGSWHICATCLDMKYVRSYFGTYGSGKFIY